MSKIKFYDWIFQNACRAHRWLERYVLIVLTTRKQLLFGALGEDLSEKPEGPKHVWGNANLCIIKTSLPKGGPPGPPQSPSLCCLPIGLKEASGLESWEFWHEFDFPPWVWPTKAKILWDICWIEIKTFTTFWTVLYILHSGVYPSMRNHPTSPRLL